MGPQRGRATFGTAAGGAAMVLQSHLERSLTHANTPLTSSQLRTTDFAKLILSSLYKYWNPDIVNVQLSAN